MADSGLNELKQRSEQYLIEMADLISRREYNLALVKGRQAMEQVVRSYARDGRVLYTDLADTIESLYQSRKIERETRDAFHQIRLLGNKAVHEGDNSPEDAEKSYYLLKKELETYLSRAAAQAADRTPVRVDKDSLGQPSRAGRRMAAYQNLMGEEASGEAERPQRVRREAAEPMLDAGMRRRPSGEDAPRRRNNAGRSSSGAANGGASGGGRARQNRVPTREDRLRAQRQQKSGRRGGGLAPADLLRILLPVLCIILLIVIVRGCVKNQPAETTAPSSSVAPSTQAPVTEPETETEPPTTEAPVVRYKVKGSAVNARYADNQNRVYEQLAAGTEIGEVETIEGSDFVKFKRDGIDLLINKNYIEPIEETTANAGTAADSPSGTTTPDETAEGGSGRVTAVLQLEETTAAEEEL